MWRALIAALLFGSWELLALGAGRLLIVRATLEHADAIVVLSGSANYPERAQWAAELYKRGLAPKIILTNDNDQGGWSNVDQRNKFFFERSLDVLLTSGVPRNAIEILLQPVSSTHDEALLVEGYINRNRLGSILLVTSAYHSRRALWTFRRVLGSGEITVGIDPAKMGSPPPATWWLHLSGWRAVPLEYVKLAYYHVRF